MQPINNVYSTYSMPELAADLAKKFDISLIKAEIIVKSFRDSIASALSQSKPIEIRGLGSFKVIEHAERRSINPKTGERLQTPAKHHIKFKPSSRVVVLK